MQQLKQQVQRVISEISLVQVQKTLWAYEAR